MFFFLYFLQKIKVKQNHWKDQFATFSESFFVAFLQNLDGTLESNFQMEVVWQNKMNKICNWPLKQQPIKIDMKSALQTDIKNKKNGTNIFITTN